MKPRHVKTYSIEQLSQVLVNVAADTPTLRIFRSGNQPSRGLKLFIGLPPLVVGCTANGDIFLRHTDGNRETYER